jgi:hypothetical protein
MFPMFSVGWSDSSTPPSRVKVPGRPSGSGGLAPSRSAPAPSSTATSPQVIATPSGLRLSASGPSDSNSNSNSTCTNGGKEWHRGATDSDCTVTFRTSTASSGSYTISASINWHVHWAGSQNTGGELAPPPNAPSGDRAVQVDQVQTAVNGQPTP